MSEQVSPTTTSSSQDENQNKDTPVSRSLKKKQNDKRGRSKKKPLKSAFSNIITFREQKKIVRKVLDLDLMY